MIKIMQIYPYLDPKINLCNLSKNSAIMARELHNSSKKQTKSLREWFPKTNLRIMHIMEEMLQINPFMRPTALQLLQKKMFDGVRMP
jgi:hypothetical protein